jgi:hypothetical protein
MEFASATNTNRKSGKADGPEYLFTPSTAENDLAFNPCSQPASHSDIYQTDEAI